MFVAGAARRAGEELQREHRPARVQAQQALLATAAPH